MASETEKAIAAILRGEQVTPRSRIEARLCNIGTGGGSGEAIISDAQVTTGMNSIFGEGNWSE